MSIPVEKLREMFPRGTGVRCIEMNDSQAVPSGTIGKVLFVDDIGTIDVRWDTGSSMGLMLDEDKFEIVVRVTMLKCGQPRPYADSEYEYILDTNLSQEELRVFCKDYPCAGRSKKEFTAMKGNLAVYFAGWSEITKISEGKYRYYAYRPYAD